MGERDVPYFGQIGTAVSEAGVVAVSLWHEPESPVTASWAATAKLHGCGGPGGLETKA